MLLYIFLKNIFMSRHIVKKENITIAYGYDDMMPYPLGGYFFQVIDTNAIDDEKNPEGFIVNEGMLKGISRNKMAELMLEYGVKNHSHLTNIALDLPI
jgi:hypothetical protein